MNNEKEEYEGESGNKKNNVNQLEFLCNDSGREHALLKS